MSCIASFQHHIVLLLLLLPLLLILVLWMPYDAAVVATPALVAMDGIMHCSRAISCHIHRDLRFKLQACVPRSAPDAAIQQQR